jgi:hypothetical protein
MIERRQASQLEAVDGRKRPDVPYVEAIVGHINLHHEVQPLAALPGNRESTSVHAQSRFNLLKSKEQTNLLLLNGDGV